MKPEEGHWIDDETPPPVVAAYLENLVSVADDRQTDLEFAAEHGMDARTLRRWKKDERFRKLWSRKADDSVLGPATLSLVYDSAVKIVADPNHPQWAAASKLIMQLADKIRPPTIQIDINPAERMQGMSDEDLAKLLATETTAREVAPTPPRELGALPDDGYVPGALTAASLAEAHIRADS